MLSIRKMGQFVGNTIRRKKKPVTIISQETIQATITEYPRDIVSAQDDVKSSGTDPVVQNSQSLALLQLQYWFRQKQRQEQGQSEGQSICKLDGPGLYAMIVVLGESTKGQFLEIVRSKLGKSQIKRIVFRGNFAGKRVAIIPGDIASQESQDALQDRIEGNYWKTYRVPERIHDIPFEQYPF